MRISRKLKSFGREWKLVAKAITSTKHPILAHLVATRRCNLSCAYCNEYDHSSPPVPLDLLKRRIERLARLGTSAIVISGGEPLLHPELEAVISHVRGHGILAGLISNCYLLTPQRIEALNRAGLEYLQVSIDNINPDEISMKSLKVLDQKLVWLSQTAEFKVNVNSVLGAFRTPQDALTVGSRASELGFSLSVGLAHDGNGGLKPLGGAEREVYLKMKRIAKKGYTRINQFQDKLVEGRRNEWRCRAGARYLYVCEDGLVHYCSQQRGYPGVPLENYTDADIRREYLTRKGCADFCTVSCVHQVSLIDSWRDPQTAASHSLQRKAPGSGGEMLCQID
jgi:MoaA/NifB/PqqE/SkfB family radical SAM enzyme